MPDRFIEPILIIIAISMLAWIIFGAVVNFSKKKYDRKISYKAELILFMFYIYAISVMTLTIIPLPFNRLKYNTRSVNIIPLVNTVSNLKKALIWPGYPFAERTFQNFLGNIILFIPLGIFLPFFSYRYRSLIHVTIFAFICSASIETIQGIERLFEIYRFVDIDDVILNTLGAMFGFIIINNLFFKHNKMPGRGFRNL